MDPKENSTAGGVGSGDSNSQVRILEHGSRAVASDSSHDGRVAPHERIAVEVTLDADSQIRQIREIWAGMQATVAQKSIEVGQRLIELKKTHPGGWSRLFGSRSGDHSMSQAALPFSQSKANVLMKIARHGVLTDSQHAANL